MTTPDVTYREWRRVFAVQRLRNGAGVPEWVTAELYVFVSEARARRRALLDDGEAPDDVRVEPMAVLVAR